MSVNPAANLARSIRERFAAELAFLGVRPVYQRLEHVFAGPFLVRVTIPDNATTAQNLIDLSNWFHAQLADAGFTTTGEKLIVQIDAIEVRAIFNSGETEALAAELLRNLTIRHKVNNDDRFFDVGIYAGTRFQAQGVADTNTATKTHVFGVEPATMPFLNPLRVDCENDILEIYTRNAVNLQTSAGVVVELVLHGAAWRSQMSQPDVLNFPLDIPALEGLRRAPAAAAARVRSLTGRLGGMFGF